MASAGPAIGRLHVMRLRCRKHVGWAAGLCLGAAVVLSLFIHLEEPGCGHHPISYWFRELPPTSVSTAGSLTSVGVVEARGRKYGIQRERPKDTLEAIQTIGAKGLPFILRKLNRQETPVTRWAEWCAAKFGIKRSIFPDRDYERMQAVTALLALGPLPLETTGELRSLSKGTNSIARAADFVLGADTNAELRVILVSRMDPEDSLLQFANQPWADAVTSAPVFLFTRDSDRIKTLAG